MLRIPRQTPEQRFCLYGQFIPEFASFCKKLSEPLPVHLRVNTLKAPLADTHARLERQGFALEPEEPLGMVFRARNLAQVGHLPEYALGHLHSQALSSVLAGFALTPRPDDMVLDLCAAPGSKTSLLAQLMENRGIIVANDPSSPRLATLVANLKRLGVTNTVTTRYRGQHFPGRFAFDRVLVDVPCSAEGTVRVISDGTLPGTVQRRAKLPALQRQLLLRAFDLLKPGGTLVYSTCTYNPVENESVVQFLMENRPAAVQPIPLDITHSPGLNGWKETVYDSSLQYCWRIYPHQLDTVGFFLARVDKKS